jgi:hypothetical protein
VQKVGKQLHLLAAKSDGAQHGERRHCVHAQTVQTTLLIGTILKTQKNIKSALSKGTVVCLIVGCAAYFPAYSATMSRKEAREASNEISTEYQRAKIACGSVRNNARDICLQEAKGIYKIAQAELEYKDEPSPRHLRNVGIAQADSAFKVAKEKCDDSTGAAKSTCRSDAKAAHKAALVEVKAKA